jgi:hypothetical protein
MKGKSGNAENHSSFPSDLPLRASPLWEKGVGGMRGKSVTGMQKTAHLSQELCTVERGCPEE